MGWQILEKKIVRTGSPTISLNNKGRLGLNMAATKILQSQAVENVLVLWDAEKQKIGLRPITKKDPRAHKISYGVKGNGAHFGARSVVEEIGYEAPESKSFPATWNEEDNVLEAEIPTEYLKRNAQKKLNLAAV